MMRRISVCVSLLGAAGLIVYAADFWKDKAYTQWTPEETTKILNDSPWAQSAKATRQGGQQTGRRGGMGRRGGFGYPGGGYPGGGGGGYPGGGGGYPGGGGGSYPGGGGESMPQITATVRWQTALPVREALLRRAGVTKTDDSEVAAKLTAPTPGYVIALLGLPERLPTAGSGRYGRSTDSDTNNDDSRDRDADMLDRLKSATYLSRNNKATIFPEKVERDQDGTVLFTFPKTTPISLDDKEVEFVTRIGSWDIKRKFKLKDMVYQGRLEL
ncbi:MAG TPA: hypothetical protein VMI06_01140 [Terriglobia bacterium]|nr:hypothetical protein [Terriglobia bacterium]